MPNPSRLLKGWPFFGSHLQTAVFVIGTTTAQLPQRIIKIRLLPDQVRVSVLSTTAKFLERSIDVVRIDHDAALGTLCFGAKLGTEAVEVELAFLEVLVALELVPELVVSNEVLKQM